VGALSAVKEFPTLRAYAREKLGLRLDAGQMEAFGWYAAELLRWNERQNLTAITDPQGIEVRHFLDSLTCLLALEGEQVQRLVDVGTGAGFPGIPLKIVCPHLELTLIEATGKKAEFCRHVVHELGLQGVEVLHARAETVAHQEAHRERYDAALARAVAPMAALVEYLLPFLRVGGVAVAQKGETGPAEAQASEGALRILGGAVERLIPLQLPGVVETRYLVRVRKLAATPTRYPRRPGIPVKRPLS
jgi:16S rRNA (guanine527-N7)-methyltransferase